MKRLAILLLLIFAVGARAEWPYDAVCEIVNQQWERDPQAGERVRAGGSGTLIGTDGKQGLVLSCGHLFEHGGRTVSVKFPTIQGTATGAVIGLDLKVDLSMITIAAPAGIYGPTCVRAARQTDSELLAIGFPWYAKGKQCFTSGKSLGYDGNDLHFAAHPFVHSGYSGGALLAPDGSFVGVVCGYGDDYSYAPSGPALVRFVSRWMPCAR